MIQSHGVQLFSGIMQTKRIIFLIAIVLTINTVFAQKALKILKDDGSITYINASAVNKITFETPLAIGDTYQGGIIFYLDASGEHGLVAAPSDQSNGIPWSNGSFTTTGIAGDGVGKGVENIYLIVKIQGVSSYAASICGDLILGGYNDWYLPSKYELNLMYTNLKLASLGGFASDIYWCSTESTESSSFWAWFQNFNNGNQYDLMKNGTYYVRAVRAF